MDFAPGVWLDPLLDSRNGFGAVCSEGVFVSVVSGCSEFPHINKIEDLPSSLKIPSVFNTRMFGTTLAMLK